MTAGKQRDVSWLPSQRTGSGLSLFLVDERALRVVADGLTA